LSTSSDDETKNDTLFSRDVRTKTLRCGFDGCFFALSRMVTSRKTPAWWLSGTLEMEPTRGVFDAGRAGASPREAM